MMTNGKFSCRGWLAVGLCAAAIQATATAPTRVQRPLTVDEVPELRGYLGERWQANRTGSLHGFDIERYVRLVEQRSHRDWWWAGEQDGKWLESAVLSSVHGDPALRAKAQAVLARIIASQDADGYLGVTARDLRTPQQPLRGMDPYEIYFRLHALITAYEQWGDQAALDAARRLGNYFIVTIGPDKAEFWPSDLRAPENRGKTLAGTSAIAGHAVHYGWEGTLLADPMLRLAQVTGEQSYADWSRWVVGNIDRWSGWDSFSKLEEVAAGKLGVHELQPYVHAHTFHMNFLGFLRLYELSGDPSYLRKVAGAWRDIASRQMYITGGVSVGEHYEAGTVKPVTGHVVETCATMSWLQITQALLELTGEAKYADAMEKLIWNHVFAAQSVDGETYRYHTPPNGVKPQGYFHGPDCCTASGHRLVALLPTFLYGKDEKGVFVNQYGASTAEVNLSGERRLRLRQETAYPEEAAVTIVVESAPQTPLAFRLRLPAWCAAPSVLLNGQKQGGLKPGSYLALERVWKSGDQIRLDFPMTPRWVKSDAPWKTEIYHLPGGEIMHRPVAGDLPPWALVRGPVVYAVDTLWWNDAATPAPGNPGDDLAVMPDPTSLREIAKPVAGLVGPVYAVDFMTASGRKTRAPMVPFTNIGRWYRADRPKPDRNAAAYGYAVWMQAADAPAFAERMRLAREDARLLAETVDTVRIGEAASEAAHRVDGGTIGTFRDRAFRHGREFGYELKISPERDSVLVATWWGGDVGREFDVLANDRVIATQRLDNKQPGAFFDARYTIPLDLVAGKTDAFGRKLDRVTIRFRSRNNDIAGGLFGLRVE